MDLDPIGIANESASSAIESALRMNRMGATGMGQSLSIDVPPGSVTAWEDVLAGCRDEGLEVQMRMIDGQLAFPDEAPPATWTELRLAIRDAGMVTLRRTPNGIDVVTWGNADEALLAAWQRLANALRRVMNP